jgi:hypothetical protein
VIRGAHYDHVRGQPVDLEEQGRHHPLDLARLVHVRTLLGDGVELVEEQHAAPRAGELERVVEPGRRLAQEARHDALVAHDVEGQHRLGGDRLGQARLAVARRAVEQHTAAGFEPVTPQQLDPLVLLDQLLHRPQNPGLELERGQAPLGHDVEHQVGNPSGGVVPAQQLGRAHRRDELGQAIRDQVVLVGPLLGDDGLDESPKPLFVASPLSVHQVDEEVRARHYDRPPLMPRL